MKREMRGAEGLELCFENMMAFSGVGNVINDDDNKSKCGDDLDGGLRLSEWQDIPVELLLRILSLLDDPTVIVASGVCHGWREAISWGLTRFSLSWYVCVCVCV